MSTLLQPTIRFSRMNLNFTGQYLLHDQDRTPLNCKGNGTSDMTSDLLDYHQYQHSTVVALQCEGPPKVINT